MTKEILQPSALITDADGTLVNTLELIRHGQYEASERYLTEHGVPKEHIPNYATYEEHLNEVVGGSTLETFQRTLAELYKGRDHLLEGVNYPVLNDSLKGIQDELAPKYVEAYPGLSELLHTIGRKDIPLAIFTSGSPHHVVRNFGIALDDELGTKELFKEERDDLEKLEEFMTLMRNTYALGKFAIITCEDVEKTKPNPDGIFKAQRQLGDIALHDAIMLGDDWKDMEAGKQAGVKKLIGVTHGFANEQTLKSVEDEETNVHAITSLLELQKMLGE